MNCPGCPQLLNSPALADICQVKILRQLVKYTYLAASEGAPIDFGIIGGFCNRVNK